MKFWFVSDGGTLAGIDTWDVASDDQRFAMLSIGTESSGTAGRIVLVQNFFGELRRLVPN